MREQSDKKGMLAKRVGFKEEAGLVVCFARGNGHLPQCNPPCTLLISLNELLYHYYLA